MLQRNPTESRCRGAVFGGLLLAFVAAAPSVARAQDLSCGPGDVEVRSLKFEGNTAVSDDELALRVTTTPSSAFRRNLKIPLGAKRCLNRAYLARDMATIEFFYIERGYNYAKADTVITPLGKAKVRVTFTIVEGPVTTLDSLSVSGLNGVADSAASVRNLLTRQGQPFSFSRYLADLDSITKRLRNSGYYRATTMQSIERDSLNAKAEIIVVPGQRAKFGVPVINVTPMEGRSQQVSDDVVRRVVGIPTGAYFSDRAITDAQRALFQIGVYRHVEVAPIADSLQPPGDSTVILDVRLTEDLMKRLDTEYGWATLDCGRVRAQYTDLNFLRSARRFEFTGQASKIGYGRPLATAGTRKGCTLNGQSPLQQDSVFSDSLHYYVGALFRQPRLMGTRWVPTVSLYRERRGEFKAYLRTTIIGADASATREIGERMQLRLGYSQEFGSTAAPDAVLCALFSRCDDDSRRDILKQATLGVASATISRLRTDNLVSPTRGTVIRAEVRTSASRFLGTSDSLFFHKGSFETAFYTPFGGRNVLSLRLRAGLVHSPRETFIPPQERLYAGGPNSVRGFQQNELGDVVYIARTSDVTKGSTYQVSDTSGFDRVVPLGGNRLIVANFEYRVPDKFILPDLLQYTFFVDVGDVWNQSKGAKVEPKWTPGVGLRMITPIGPFQVNFGYNGYPRKSGPIFFEDPTRSTSAIRPDINPLYCVTPNNGIVLEMRDLVLQPPLPPVPCPTNYTPVLRRRWYERLTVTFSIGPDL